MLLTSRRELVHHQLCAITSGNAFTSSIQVFGDKEGKCTRVYSSWLSLFSTRLFYHVYNLARSTRQFTDELGVYVEGDPDIVGSTVMLDRLVLNIVG